MKVTDYPVIFLAIAMLGGSIGCESTQTRIKKHEAAFMAMNPTAQARVLEGEVELGDSSEMVFLAWGKPTHEDSITTSSGETRTVWTYTKKQLIKEGSRLASSPEGRRQVAVEDIYRVLEKIRRKVTFLDDRVVQVRNPEAEIQLLAKLASQ